MAHWSVLAAVCSLNWALFFIYDLPATLSIPLCSHLSLTDHQLSYLISLLYTVYAAPNTILPFFSGAAVQRFGATAVLTLTMSTIILGQTLFALTVEAKLPLGMIIGRALIGLGAEVVGVVGVEIITRFFQDKNLSLALAINLSAGRMGSVANTLLVPRLLEPYGTVGATWIATLLTLTVATICALYLITISSSSKDQPRNLTEDTDTDNHPSIAFPLRHFPPVFWQLALLCLLGYGVLNTFTNSAQRFLAIHFYHGNQRQAGSEMSILFLIASLLVPIFGLLLDSLPATSYPAALITANILLVLAHTIFFIDTRPNNPSTAPAIPPLALHGTADALLTVAFWASVARCLLDVDVNLPPSPRLPLFKNENQVYDPNYETFPLENNHISTTPEPESNSEPQTSTAPIPEALRTLGLGIMASLMNLATVVVPVPLAVMENRAGFAVVEAVFVGLGGLGLGVIWLGWNWEFG
ncbi:major facilitator superfamily domain-containing protein [Aspergillus egyptiacus]|nr:major facilitator superfamily domain-containing protein [Aspergillus egyptiacus]